jgi:hypothetical protein
MAVRLTGLAGMSIVDCLLDTGADDTIFEDWHAGRIGVDLRSAPTLQVALTARPQPVRCQFARKMLRITDGLRETYEWSAVVGFVPVRLHYNAIGHAGFLQFFDANFRGDDHEVILTPKPTFPGRRI